MNHLTASIHNLNKCYRYGYFGGIKRMPKDIQDHSILKSEKIRDVQSGKIKGVFAGGGKKISKIVRLGRITRC